LSITSTLADYIDNCSAIAVESLSPHWRFPFGLWLTEQDHIVTGIKITFKKLSICPEIELMRVIPKDAMEKALKRMANHLDKLGKYPNLSLQFNVTDKDSWHIRTGENGKVIEFSKGKIESPTLEFSGFSEDFYNVLTGRTPLGGEVELERIEMKSSVKMDTYEDYAKYIDIFEIDSSIL